MNLISEIYFYTENVCVTVLQIKCKSFLNIYSFCKKKKKETEKKMIMKNTFLKLRCELNNLVLRVSEAANLWYSLN